jgi:hypothetical protein
MKKITLSILLFFFIGNKESLGCDICGCGVGTYYVGILPEFNKRLMGLRYRYNQLTTHIGAGGSTSYLTTKERFHTMEWWGAWHLAPKFRVMATVPFQVISKENSGSRESRMGLGDATLNGFYQVYKKMSMLDGDRPKMVHQILWVGGGIKLPFGQYDQNGRDMSGPSINTFQLGTGSIDFLLNAAYDLRIQDLGINVNASYKINTENRDSYRYGNKATINTQVYHKFKVGPKASVSPNLGASLEYARLDRDAGYKLDVSGGRLLMGSIGAEVLAVKRWAMGGYFQTPLRQELANGFARAGNRWMAHIAYKF